MRWFDVVRHFFARLKPPTVHVAPLARWEHAAGIRLDDEPLELRRTADRRPRWITDQDLQQWRR